jgi:hypothetical protein
MESLHLAGNTCPKYHWLPPCSQWGHSQDQLQPAGLLSITRTRRPSLSLSLVHGSASANSNNLVQFKEQNELFGQLPDLPVREANTIAIYSTIRSWWAPGTRDALWPSTGLRFFSTLPVLLRNKIGWSLLAHNGSCRGLFTFKSMLSSDLYSSSRKANCLLHNFLLLLDLFILLVIIIHRSAEIS